MADFKKIIWQNILNPDFFCYSDFLCMMLGCPTGVFLFDACPHTYHGSGLF